MTATIQTLNEERVRSGLESAAPRVKALGAGAWRFALEAGAPMRGSATSDDGWLLMRAAFNAGRSEAAKGAPERLWPLLERNGRLSGGAKFVLDAADQVQIRAEVPLEDDDPGDNSARLIEEACRGFREAASRASPARGPADPAAGPAGNDLPALLTAAGWPHTVRSNGDLAVPLDVPHGFFQALIRPRAECGVSFSVDFCSRRPLMPACRAALAVLLLRTSAIVRLGRATAGEEEGLPAVRFEVVLRGGLRSVQIEHALAALSVACRVCGAECGVLARDEHLSEQFLAIRGWSSVSGRVDHQE